VTPPLTRQPLAAYVLRHGDDNLVLSQRLAEWISRAPELEEDIALANVALDHLGVAQLLLAHVARAQGSGETDDDLAFLRAEREFTNLLIVEQPNGDFAMTMARQLLFDAYQLTLWEALSASSDEMLAGIAAKALKEARYHFRHSAGWVRRLGDGTDESHVRMQTGLDSMWRFTAEMFEMDDLDIDMAASGVGVDLAGLADPWRSLVGQVIEEATLAVPTDPFQRTGGRGGDHTEHLGHLLTEMQWLQRTYPGLEW
jgi:ring-1,2-phenylacetyl-CoA epoxidase subunit PaaC